MSAAPNTAQTLYAVGHWLLEQERHEDAKDVFRSMLRMAPTDERGYLALGVCHEKTNELERAERLYSLAPLACTNAARCMIALARLLRRTDREDEAAVAYEKAATLAESSDDDCLPETIQAEMMS